MRLSTVLTHFACSVIVIAQSKSLFKLTYKPINKAVWPLLAALTLTFKFIVLIGMTIVLPENVFGSEFEFDANTGEICSIEHVPAGNGKVAVLEALELKLQMSSDRVYIGDGSSDPYVVPGVNSRYGHTIAVSEKKSIGRIANRTVLSDNAVSVLVPILENVLK